MARKGNYNYNPATGKWTKTTTPSSNKGSTQNKKSTGSGKKTNGGSKTTKKSDSKLSSGGGKKDSSGKTSKKYNNIMMNTLSGSLNFIVNEKTIKLKAGHTVQLKGLGSYLSGKYYVKEITHSLGTDGYSHSATVIKTDFGKTLKKKKKVKTKANGKKAKLKVTTVSGGKNKTT